MTPTLNRAGLIDQTARSVLDQTFDSFEYLILDDGSTDHTAGVVHALRDPRITYLHHENRGEAATTNRGWAMARGEYFAILSSDDLVKPQWLERLVRFMDENPDVVVAYPDFDIIDGHGSVMQVVATPDYDRDAMIAAFHPFPGVGAVIRRSALRGQHALRNPEYRYAPDLDSWLRLSLRGPFARVPEVLGSWRSHEGSITVAERSRRRARELVLIAQRFFETPDLGPDIQRLRRFSLAQAHASAAWVVGETSPLPSALYMRRSYALSPVQPDFIPSYLNRLPQPGRRQLVRLAAESLRHRAIQGLRILGRKLPPNLRQAGRKALTQLRLMPPIPATAPAAAPALELEAPAPQIPVPDPARERIDALMPQIQEDLAAFQDTVATLTPTQILLDHIRNRAMHLPTPPIAGITGRVLAALPRRVDHLLVLPWAHGIGGSETVTERLVEALRRHRGEDGLFIIAPDASYRPVGLARHHGIPFLGFSDIDATLDEEARAEIFDRVMTQRRPAIAHVINSRAAWHALRQHGRGYARHSALFANIYSDIRLRDGSPAASYYYDYLPHCLAHLSAVFADNRRIMDHAATSFGLGPALQSKFHLLRTPVVGLNGGDPRADLRPFQPSSGRHSLWLSRIAPEKRLDVLTQIAARCPGRHFDVRGSDNGSGTDLSALRACGNVMIDGAFGSLSDIVWDRYDSYVFTSSGEGMPIAPLEIAARGLPVIAPDVGGIREFISAETGWLIPRQDDVDAYADALMQIERDPGEAERRVAAAQALLLRDYTREAYDAALQAVPGYLGGRS